MTAGISEPCARSDWPAMGHPIAKRKQSLSASQRLARHLDSQQPVAAVVQEDSLRL